MRNVLTTVPNAAHQMVAATIRTVFVQPDRVTAKAALERVCRLFAKRFPKLVTCLLEAEDDAPAYYGFPAQYRRQVWAKRDAIRTFWQNSNRTFL